MNWRRSVANYHFYEVLVLANGHSDACPRCGGMIRYYSGRSPGRRGARYGQCVNYSNGCRTVCDSRERFGHLDEPLRPSAVSRWVELEIRHRLEENVRRRQIRRRRAEWKRQSAREYDERHKERLAWIGSVESELEKIA